MEIQGRVENGVVVLEGGAPLPDGAAVSVVYPVPSRAQPVVEKRRIELPLVHCEQPGSVHLTSEQIGEILDALASSDAVRRVTDVSKHSQGQESVPDLFRSWI